MTPTGTTEYNIFEIIMDRSDGSFDLYLSFLYRSINTGVQAKYKKGVMYTSYPDMLYSLSEDDTELLNAFIEELRLYVSRQKRE